MAKAKHPTVRRGLDSNKNIVNISKQLERRANQLARIESNTFSCAVISVPPPDRILRATNMTHVSDLLLSPQGRVMKWLLFSSFFFLSGQSADGKEDIKQRTIFDR
jgi:hypothetical protein